MSVSETSLLRPVGAPGGAAETPAPPADATFRRLLERLETLVRTPAAPVADAADLQLALRRAEDDYVVAMDLRRQLEAAVRGQ
jgi:hypothetical protein